jgi:hypothetical protein
LNPQEFGVLPLIHVVSVLCYPGLGCDQSPLERSAVLWLAQEDVVGADQIK